MQRRPNLTMFIFSCQIKEHDEEFSASSGNQASVPFFEEGAAAEQSAALVLGFPYISFLLRACH